MSFKDSDEKFELEIKDTIKPATSYRFNVKLIANSKQLEMTNGKVMKMDMESKQVSIDCSTKPAKPYGKWIF